MRGTLIIAALVATAIAALLVLREATTPESEVAAGASATPEVGASDQAAAPETGAATGAETTQTAIAPAPSAADPAAEQESSAAPAEATGRIEVVRRPDPAQTEADPDASSVPAPSFDVVRVEPTGETVIAGRAAPGSTVTVLDGDTPLGTVTADARGQWVLVLDTPLSPGSHSLGLKAWISEGSTVLLSEHVAVVVVPAPPQVAAAPAAPEAGGAPASAGAAAAAKAPSTMTAKAEGLMPSPAAAEQQTLAVLMPRSGVGPSLVLQQPEAPQEGLAKGSLVLETVDYDESGRAAVAGRATPGARVVIFLDGKTVGETDADGTGRWSLVLDRAVGEGLHRLGVEQVDHLGKVASRVETPFLRAAMVATLPDETRVVVQPGNSLWRIARRIYGEGTRYTVIYRANQVQIDDPDLIYPGQIFAVPPEISSGGS